MTGERRVAAAPAAGLTDEQRAQFIELVEHYAIFYAISRYEAACMLANALQMGHEVHQMIAEEWPP